MKAKLITRQGWERLSAELQQLWKVERPEVTRAVSEAAALGDRSENAEYIYGKKRLREIDRRVGYLSRQLEDLKIVDYAPEQEGRVFFGATVEVENEAGTVARYRIVGGDEIEVAHVVDRRGLTVEGRDDVHLVSVAPDRVVLEVGGIARAFATAIHATNGGTEVFVDGPLGPVALTVVDRFPDPADQTAPGSLLAAMPGSVVRIAAAVGDAVVAGQPILWLEAMKMQHEVQAPADGTITELSVSEGDQVDVGAVLAVVTAADPAAEPDPSQQETE